MDTLNLLFGLMAQIKQFSLTLLTELKLVNQKAQIHSVNPDTLETNFVDESKV